MVYSSIYIEHNIRGNCSFYVQTVNGKTDRKIDRYLYCMLVCVLCVCVSRPLLFLSRIGIIWALKCKNDQAHFTDLMFFLPSNNTKKISGNPSSQPKAFQRHQMAENTKMF